jgi:hypothetical protein
MAVDATSGAVYELTVNGETVILEEGESVEFGMRALSPQPEPGKVMPMAIYTSNAGTLSCNGGEGKVQLRYRNVDSSHELWGHLHCH